MRVLVLLFLFLPLAVFSQQKSHGVIDMDTIQQYHPFAIEVKKQHFKMQQAYIDTLKRYQLEYNDFLSSIIHADLPDQKSKDLVNKKLEFLANRITGFENVATTKLETFSREKYQEFMVILQKQLAEFATIRQVGFLIDKSKLIYCWPCSDYSHEFLKWIGAISYR